MMFYKTLTAHNYTLVLYVHLHDFC